MRRTLSTAALLAVFGVLYPFAFAKAAVIYQQPQIDSEHLGNSTEINRWFPVYPDADGNGFIGYLDTITVIADGNLSDPLAEIECWEEFATSSAAVTFSNQCDDWQVATTSQFIKTNVSGAFQYVFSTFLATGTPVAFEQDKYYVIDIDWNGSANIRGIFGSDLNNPTQNHCKMSAPPGDYTCRGIPYLYINNVDGDYPENFTNSYVIRQNSPQQSEVTDTTTVTFDFDYLNTGYEGFTKAGVALSNLTASQSIIVPEQDILQTGEATYSQNMLLQEGHAYLYRAYLRNPETNQRVQGQTIIFHVVENQGGQSLIPDLDENNATTTFETAFGSFMGAIDLLETKFPFNWFTEVIRIFTELDDSSEEQAELTLDFSSVSTTTDTLLGGNPITLFSSTTVAQFMPIGFLTIIRTFIAGTLYFALATNIFFTIRRRFA